MKVQKLYYHYDNNFYKNGDNVKPKKYTLSTELVDIYNNIIGLNSDSLIYMLDHVNDDYYESYKYLYKVTPKDVKSVFMDYSPFMCQQELNKNIKKWETIFGEKSNNIITDFIKCFAESYLGNKTAKQKLYDVYKYPISDKIEYISNNVVVSQSMVTTIIIKELNLPQLEKASESSWKSWLNRCINEFISDLHGIKLISCSIKRIRMWHTFKITIKISYSSNEELEFFKDNIEQHLIDDYVYE